MKTSFTLPATPQNPPCEKCKHSRICVTEDMACKDFAQYIGKKGIGRGREPSKAVFEYCFGED